MHSRISSTILRINLTCMFNCIKSLRTIGTMTVCVCNCVSLKEVSLKVFQRRRYLLKWEGNE